MGSLDQKQRNILIYCKAVSTTLTDISVKYFVGCTKEMENNRKMTWKEPSPEKSFGGTGESLKMNARAY